jgi:hypothetical protein
VRANPLIEFVNLADNRGPDRRRSGSYPERISSCYIKALRSSELGSRFGAYSYPGRFRRQSSTRGEAWRSSGRAANQISSQPQKRRVLGLNIPDKMFAIADQVIE